MKFQICMPFLVAGQKKLGFGLWMASNNSYSTVLDIVFVVLEGSKFSHAVLNYENLAAKDTEEGYRQVLKFAIGIKVAEEVIRRSEAPCEF